MTQETLEREIQGKIRHYETAQRGYNSICSKLAGYIIPALNKRKSVEGIVESIPLKGLAEISQNYEEALRLVEELYTTTIEINQIAAIYKSQTKQSFPDNIEGFLKRNCGIFQVQDFLETRRELSAISTDMKYAIEDYKAVQIEKDAEERRKKIEGSRKRNQPLMA